MKSIGLKPTKNSGSGWIEKEDGQNDFLICQLKSTDAQSIKVNQKDIRVLERNANIEHKIPIFAIQFLNTNEVWLMAKPTDFVEVSEYIQTGKIKSKNEFLDLDVDGVEDVSIKTTNTIKSNENAREAFHERKQRKYKRERKAW